MDKTRQKLGIAGFVVAFGLAVCNHSAAQITTDGSTGAQVTLSGPDVTIEESLGTRAGSNLFHSFDTFNISSGASATFTGAADIQNVVSRVTGGQVSNIQGSLRSEVGNADFYFINPAGVTFGEGGSVDVPASFHLSTNDELRFSDGTVLDTDSPAMSEFSTFEPEVFGYLSQGTGVIEVTGTQIEVLNGDIGVTGGELLISEGGLSGLGDINIEVSDSAVIENGGTIATVAINNSNGGNINLNANELFIDAQGSGLRTGIFSSVFSGTGNGGDINLSIGETATLQGRGEVASITEGGEGDAGSIELNAVEVLMVDGGNISGITGSGGDSGDILITADQLSINGQGPTGGLTGVFNAVGPGSTGDAGNIQVSIAETVTMQSGGLINSLTFTESNAADLTLSAKQIILESDDPVFRSGLASLSAEGATGDAGNINLFIEDQIIIREGGWIITETLSQGNAGDINLTSSQLLIDGQTNNSATGISSSARGESTGNAGTIDISVSGLATIQNGGSIGARTTSSGDAGSVLFDANRLELSNSQILSNTFAQGDAGNVVLSVNELLIDSGAVSSSATGDSGGDAGEVTVSFDEQLTIQNSGIVATRSDGGGDPGSVTINSTTGSILLTQNSGITSAADSDNGNAGDINISTGGSVIIDSSQVETVARGGTSGQLSISAGTLDTRDASIRSTTTSAVADGGDISVEADVFILAETVIQANAISGSGGVVTVSSDAVIPFGNQLQIQPLVPMSGNSIQAVAQDGVTIAPTINAPETDFSAAITNLNAVPGNASAVASDPCASFIEGSPSSLVESGRSGFPVTNATITNLPTVAAQVSFTEHQVPVALNDTDVGDNQPLVCRSG